MRILVATVPAAGHFNPLTGPALRLAELGHDVRWYAGPEYASRVEQLGLAVIPYREATEITADSVNALFPERQKLRGPKAIAFDADVFFAGPVRAQFHDIREAREGFPFDALLIDGAFYAGYLAAKRLGVPVFAMGSIAAPTLRGDTPVTPFFGLRPPRSFLGRIVNRVARGMLVSSTRRAVETFNGYLAEEGLPPLTAEAFAGGDRLLVVVTGGVGTDELRSRYPYDNVLIEDYVDFDLLFPHAELYVTNGGLGGVLLALSHGVPLLVAGTREGKGDINVRLAYRGLAADLRSEQPSARAVARGAARVLHDEDMRDRVAGVKVALAANDSVGIIERGLLASLHLAYRGITPPFEHGGPAGNAPE